MTFTSRAFAALALAAALCAPAAADTLYQSAPPPAGPGHPLRLGPDHKAQQVGDLVQIVFNFAVNSTSSSVTNINNNYSIGVNPGTGLANVSVLRFGAGVGAQRQTANSKTQTGQNTFVSTMEATVTDVLPSGALRIVGEQALNVNGQIQHLHVTGLVRPDDIDNTDSVPSNRIADVQTTFSGNFEDKHQGVLTRILNFLF